MTSATVSGEEALKLPYLKLTPNDGRMVTLKAFFDHLSREWHLYLPVAPGQLGRVAGGMVFHGSYLAASAEAPDRDLEFPLGTLIAQHLSFPEVVHQLGKLENDFHRCAAVLEKYLLFWTAEPDAAGSGFWVLTEFEYLLFLLRALYDVMQALVREVCCLIKLDGTRVVRNLPASFADVALKEGHSASVELIEQRWKLPSALANWYFGEAPFFRLLRKLRTATAHLGLDPPAPFRIEWGFAVNPSEPPWIDFDQWPNERLWNARLGSMRALFLGLISHAVQSANRLAGALEQVAPLPPSMLKNDVKLFLRSPFGAQLVSLEQTRANPWEGKAENTVV